MGWHIRGMRKSSTDAEFEGVCGGLAEYTRLPVWAPSPVADPLFRSGCGAQYSSSSASPAERAWSPTSRSRCACRTPTAIRRTESGDGQASSRLIRATEDT